MKMVYKAFKVIQNKIDFKLILLVIIVVVVNTITIGKYYPNSPTFDAYFYEEVAKTLLEGRTTLLDEGEIVDIGNEVTPGYAIFIAAIYKITWQDPLNVYLFQILLNVLSVLLVYQIMKSKTNNLIALFSSVFLAIYFPIWRYNFDLLMEILTIFLLLGSIYYLLQYESKDYKIKYLILFSVFFSLLVFLNNRFIVHFGVAILVFMFYCFKYKNYSIKHVLISVTIFILILLPWHIRQAYVYDHFIVFTPTWTNLIHDSFGIIPKVDIKTDLDRPDSIKSYEIYIQQIKKTRNDDTYKQFSKEKYDQLVASHPNKSSNKQLIKYYTRAIAFWEIASFDFKWEPGIDYRISLPSSRIALLTGFVFLLPIFILMLIGTFYAFENKDKFFQIVFFFIIGHWLLHVVVHYIGRYRITILPLIFMLGWYGFYNLFIKTKLKKIEY